MLKEIYIVIPTYNESNTIKDLLIQIFKEVPDIKVLIVDDNSPDGTAGEVEIIKKILPNKLFLLKRSGKLGLGSAYREGFGYCLGLGASVVGEMDADFSHQPKDLFRLVKEIENGAGVVIGSRRVKGGKIIGWGVWRHFSSWSANMFSRVLLGLSTKDVTAGFRLYTRDALAVIPWQKIKSNGYAWQEEMIFWGEKYKLKISEVPVEFIDRRVGKSKLNYRDVIDFFITIFRLVIKSNKKYPA